MDSIRIKFVKRFGEEQAKRLEDAAEEHAYGRQKNNRGSDPFKWVFMITIGFDCFVKESFRMHHAINIPINTLKKWIKENAELGTHDGEYDAIALFAGTYNEYVPKQEVK